MNNLIEALSITILHSLWQGLLIAVVLGIFLKIFKKHKAEKRYFTSIVAMFLLAVTTIVTFAISYHSEGNSLAMTEAMTELGAGEIYVIADKLPEQGLLTKAQATYQSMVSLIKTYSSTIFVIWLLGVGFFSLRFVGGLYYIQKIKTQKVSPVSDFWNKKLLLMCQKMSINSKVTMLKSHLVEVPTVVGWLRPVILIPVSMMAQMPVAELEGVLAHELAHIRRHDYLLNMIQSIIEIALFYNPAAWWISVCINDERENCCDDVALKTTGSAKDYIKALANLAQSQYKNPELALSVMGKKGSVLYRIRRIVSLKQNQFETSHALSHKTVGRFAAAMFMLVALIVFTISSGFNESIAKGFSMESMNLVEDNELTDYQEVSSEFISGEDTTKKKTITVTGFSSGDTSSVIIGDSLSWKTQTIFLEDNDSSSSKVFFFGTDGSEGNILIEKKQTTEEGTPIKFFISEEDTTKKGFKYKVNRVGKVDGKNHVFVNVNSSENDSVSWIVKVAEDSITGNKSYRYYFNEQGKDKMIFKVDSTSYQKVFIIDDNSGDENTVIIDTKSKEGQTITEYKGKGQGKFYIKKNSLKNGKSSVYVNDSKIDVERIVEIKTDGNFEHTGEGLGESEGVGAIGISEKGQSGVSLKKVQINGSGLGKNNVLFILDGKEVKEGVLKPISPNDIESIEVIKDKKAIKKYGKKDIDGVIVIHTKGGKKKEKVKIKVTKTSTALPDDVLVFIDGIESDPKDLKGLTKDIAKIEVIKGEAATQKYGAKTGKVIIVTTKSGDYQQKKGIFPNRTSVLEKSLVTYPNPTNGIMNLAFSTKKKGKVKIDIYNLSGKRVATVLNEVLSQGNHNISWDTKDLESGAYILQLKANGERVDRKVLVNK